MLLWLLQCILFSVGIILVIHHILQFFKNTLTTPKVKDLITQTKTQYKEIEDVLSTPSPSPSPFVFSQNIERREKEEIEMPIHSEEEPNEYSIYDI